MRAYFALGLCMLLVLLSGIFSGYTRGYEEGRKNGRAAGFMYGRIDGFKDGLGKPTFDLPPIRPGAPLFFKLSTREALVERADTGELVFVIIPEDKIRMMDKNDFPSFPADKAPPSVGKGI